MENFKVIIVEDVPLELKGTLGIIRTDIPEAEELRLFRDFSEDEKKVMDVFAKSNVVHLDDIIVGTDLSPSKIASILLSLEFDGVLTALPGKRYQKL